MEGGVIDTLLPNKHYYLELSFMNYHLYHIMMQMRCLKKKKRMFEFKHHVHLNKSNICSYLLHRQYVEELGQVECNKYD